MRRNLMRRFATACLLSALALPANAADYPVTVMNTHSLISAIEIKATFMVDPNLTPWQKELLDEQWQKRSSARQRYCR